MGEARAALISSVFERLDVDGDEVLSPREMRRFAELTGFDGGEGEWNEAFKALMTENGRPDATGVDLMMFAKLVEDTSADTGCHCTDDELKTMLEKLPQHAEAAPSSISRLDLIAAVFKQLDIDCDGMLSAREMRKFAEQTGFEGSSETWAKEYKNLCTESGSKDGEIAKLDLAFFSRLVNDRSADSGCYCNDDELHAMLARLGGHTGPTAPAPKPAPGAVLFPMSTYRSSLVRSVFDRLDTDRDSRLSQKEMRAFAGHTGFECSESVWAQEFKQLCSDNQRNPEDGVDYVFFCKLVNDQGQDSGCYCTDTELQVMLAKLGGPSIGVPKAHGGAGLAVTEKPAEVPDASPHDTPSEVPAATPDRSALVRSVFQAFDADQDGRLNKQEMRSFAESTGFDGDDAAWDEAYKVLCREKKRDPQYGVDLNFFSSLVNDKEDSAGCYCTDSELSAAIAKVSAQPRAKAKVTSSAAAVSPWAAAPRNQLIESVFSGLDIDKDGKLNQSEMKAFAVLTGFEGSEAEWAEAFKGLCTDAGGGSNVDLTGFTVLVDDPSDDTGCHCSDTDLREMLEKLKVAAPALQSAMPKARSKALAMKPPELSSRTELIEAIFQKLDVDCDGKLDQKEMRRFAEVQDFEGTDEEWAEAYKELFAEKGRDPSQGVDLYLFTQLVNDESEDTGCHCTDAEMRTMLKKL